MPRHRFAPLLQQISLRCLVPIYVYEVILEDGSGGETFEALQQMNDPPLTHHPETGLPLRRVLTAAAIAGSWSGLKGQSNLSDKNLEAKGFTKYVNMGDGKYEKQVGKGPKFVSRTGEPL